MKMTITTELAQPKPATIENVRNRIAYLEGLNSRGVGTAVTQQQWELLCLRELAFSLDALAAKDKQIAVLSTERDEFRSRLKLEREILEDADRDLAELRQRIAELEARPEQQPVAFDAIRDTVAEMTGGLPMEWREGVSKGHHEVPFMNFNSLSRIVDKFRDAAAAQPVTVKLPEPLGFKPPSGRPVVLLSEVVAALTAAGITIAEGE